MVRNRAFGKTLIRTYLNNKGRFLANFLTVLVSVFLTAGLSSLPLGFAQSYGQIYAEGKAPDLIVKSKAYTGLTEEQVSSMGRVEGVESVQTLMSFDAAEADGTYHRYIIWDFATSNIASPTVIEGTLPQNRGEVAIIKPTKNQTQYRLGDAVELEGMKAFVGHQATITAVLDSPLYNCVAREQAELEDQNNVQYIQAIFFLERSTIPHFLRDVRTDAYIRFTGEHQYFSSEYSDAMDARREQMARLLGEDEVAVLTLEETTSYALFKNYNVKIVILSYIFPAFFLALCALINHITVTRLIKDERSSLAVYSSVGVDKKRVVAKYSIFIGASVFLGSIFGYFLGTPLVPKIIEPAYNAVFAVGNTPLNWYSPIGRIVVLALTLLSIGIALYSSLMYLREEPSDLMHDKAPTPGKKIFLEHVPFVWRAMSFSFKSSFRNIFRQKKNLVLTGLCIGGSTLLIFLGFSLLNVSDTMANDELFSDVGQSMGLISTFVVLLAVAMAVPVLFSLVSMNIEDRHRELATLKVLGYHDIECSMYTFREIVIITVVSLLIAVPSSAGIADVVLRYIGFGSLQDVVWWTYVASAGIVLVTTFSVNFMLFPRIKAIDMNASLKSVE